MVFSFLPTKKTKHVPESTKSSSKGFKIHDSLLDFVNQHSPKSAANTQVETIGVFGLGFVGSSIAAVWLRYGATVVGYDISTQRINDIKNQRYSWI